METFNITKEIEIVNDAALKLFVKNGYHNTSIEEVANKAGYSKGLILYYYNRKINILDSILKNSISQIVDKLDPFGYKKDYHNLDEIFSKTADILRDNKTFWKLSYQVIFHKFNFPSQYQLINQKIDQPFHDMLIKYFSTKTSKNVQIYTSMFTYLINGVFYGVLFKNKPYLTKISELDKMFKL